MTATTLAPDCVLAQFSPAALEEEDQAWLELGDNFKQNAHIHLPPNFSAFESVDQAIALAAAQGIRALGASNYYDYSLYREFGEATRAVRIHPLFGIEVISLIPDLVQNKTLINDPGNPGRMYLCGKGITAFDLLTREAERLLGTIRRNDTERIREMIGKMAQIFEAAGLPTGLDEAAIIARVVRRHGCPPETVTLQERHVAQAFQEILFERVPAAERAAALEKVFAGPTKVDIENGPQVQNEIRSRLMKAGKPAFALETFLGFEEAYRLVLELCGIPCYPTLADGAKPICGFEDPVEKLIAELKARNIHCAEFIPIRNQPEVLARYVTAVREAGLVVTGGTEHNTLDLIPIEPACVGGAPVPEEIKTIFREGACVVAAHQYLTARGECGYVDGQGRLNPAFETQESRIAALRNLGACLIQATLNKGE